MTLSATTSRKQREYELLHSINDGPRHWRKRKRRRLRFDGAAQAMSTVDPAAQNIQTIATLEEEALRQRTTAERFSDRITKIIGSMTFVVVHLVVFALWFLVNVNLIPGLAPFDPFPFGILTLIVSTE